MRIEIITIGDEVLEGQAVNTNAAFLGQELSSLGYPVAEMRVVPDSFSAIESALKKALSSATLVITTGGLGPTIDDLTKSVAAACLGKELVLNEELYAELKKRYPDSEALKIQALVLQDAKILPNRFGTASGLLFLSNGPVGSLLLLPGPPREMEPMYRNEAVSLIQQHFPLSNPAQMRRYVLCATKELDLDGLLREIQLENPDAEIGIYPSYGTIQVRLRIRERFERFQVWEKSIRDLRPTHLCLGPSLPEALHQLLIETKKTVAFAESCTGGAISQRLTAMDGASAYLLGSVVAYSNQWKEEFLGVRKETIETHGAVSSETVLEMAHGLLQKTQADYAVAVSGIAGPTGGSQEKPIGTVYIALLGKDGSLDVGRLPALMRARSSVIEYAVQSALGALYRKIVYNVKSFS